MLVADKIMSEIQRILEMTSDFEIDGYFKVNGISEHVDISQNALTNSQFSFNYADKKLLHFTNLNSALQIWKSKYIKSSNLNSLADKNELVYSLNLINQNQIDTDIIKDQTFVACFTPKRENKSIREYLVHWELYSNNHNGVAFEFEIIKPHLDSYIYSLNVNYIDSVEQNKLLKYLSINATNPVSIKAIIPLLVSLKQMQFKSEEEIRIVSQYSREILNINSLVNYPIEYYIDKFNKLQYFVKLSLLYGNEDENNEYSSILRLKKIYFGKNVNTEDSLNLINKFFTPQCDKYGIEFDLLGI